MRPSAYLTGLAIMPALLLAGCGKPTASNAADADMTAGNTGTTAAANDGGAPWPSAVTTAYSVSRTNAGKPAPTGEFIGPDGAASLAKFAGKPFLLVTWDTTNPDSQAQLPILDALAAEGKIAVVSLNVDSRPDDTHFPDTVTPFVAAHRMLKKLVVYRDPHGNVQHDINQPTPAAILYDSQGKQVWQMSYAADYINDPKVRALIAEAK